ncbi:hypothetical protein WR25_17909 [Diploscapter pachys]|uniref:Metalloendopeptidase n=1 Tax=Diploscapter pachys TaxID=2018661 RepID=A0A2A2KTL3_9BILA|nr:hypothetical protein WR25_17909 [Diploscapter pachys]
MPVVFAQPTFQRPMKFENSGKFETSSQGAIEFNQQPLPNPHAYLTPEEVIRLRQATLVPTINGPSPNPHAYLSPEEVIRLNQARDIPTLSKSNIGQLPNPHAYLTPEEVMRLNQATESPNFGQNSYQNDQSYKTPEEVMREHAYKVLPDEPTLSQPQTFGMVTMSNSSGISELEEYCRTSDCTKQKEESRICKSTLMNSLNNYMTQVQGKDATKDIQKQFDTVFEYKKALCKKAGLSDKIIPADNGVVDGDIILTLEQAIFFLDEIKSQMKNATDKHARKKRSGIFFENANIIRKWDVSKPIQYKFDKNLKEKEKSQILNGIKMIENSMPGIVAHELLHVLGIAHTHQRVDRDKHIKSIMHYKGSFSPRSMAKSTMIPLKDPLKNKYKMGQRKKLSGADIEILNKMYCKKTCKDRKVFCGIWALNGLCKTRTHRKYMRKYCELSCNYCGAQNLRRARTLG